MKASTKSLCAVVLGCAFAGYAAAATTAPADSTNAQNAQAPAHIGQKLRDNLTKAGFTDITIMPSSFLVRAKDSEGNPVMMVINPDSITEVTQQVSPTKSDEPPVSGAIKGDGGSSIPAPTPKSGTKP
jgi:hypothetical protein